MYTVVEYVNYRKENEISVHGYFNDLEKAIQYSTGKSLEKESYLNEKENNYLLKINKKDCFVDIEDYVFMRSVKGLGEVVDEINCVVFPKKIYNEIYENVIKKCLNFLDTKIGKKEGHYTKDNVGVFNLLEIIFDNENDDDDDDDDDESLSKFVNNDMRNKSISDCEEYLKELFTLLTIEGKMKKFININDIVYQVSNQVFAIVKISENNL